ncbi:MAG: methylated-DNA--[protein]-cysteine S-methyltransferase [Anaerolineales bacterium]|nr:methylated-DNA--[protein]-cysteine S-methyltransferase [Anaerolineales bacterium]WKZ41206.1 MAG: methylated-DNA--[protein]-cysteine S-methyltransferase [Anaerolineales bacterium]
MDSSTVELYLGELNGTPLGDLRLVVSDFGLVAVEWADSQPALDAYLARLKRPVQPDARKVKPYAKELAEYLNQRRTAFTIPVDWTFFTPFQREALQAVYRIPYGETRTYIDIAREINRPLAYRAVGAANAMNPMPLVIPCHRVIGMDGKLHGYGGGQGLPTKEWLLKMEGAVIA